MTYQQTQITKLRNFNRVDQTYDDENNIFNLTEIENSGDLLYSFVSADLWIDDTGSFLTARQAKHQVIPIM